MAQIPQNRQFQEAKVPSHWGTSERRYAQGVNDLFERLFYMFGRLSKDDLAKPLNKEITDATGNILRIESDVDQVKLTLTTVQGDVSTLTLSAQEFATRLSNAEGDISTLEQTATSFGTRISNAEGDISTLEQTATGLQTQVNNLGNRNRTYLPGTVPSVSERVEGDLLIDTANGNILKRWNGSAWVAVQDGAISIAQQQADKIQWLVASGTSAANMTLTSKLYSLMAANIDLSANNSIKLTVGNINIGGTNMLRNSGNIPAGAIPETWGAFGHTTLDVYTNDPWGHKYIYIDRETAGEYILYSRNYNLGSFAVGDEYTISYYTSNGWTFPQVQICDVTDFSQWALRFGQVTQKRMENGIYYHEATAKVTQAQSSGMSLVFTLTGRNIFITRIKLEKGNKATAWSPSPEEVEAKISMTPNMIKLAVDELQIGGANLLEGTSADFKSFSLGSGNSAIYPSSPLGNFGGLLPGETVTFRAWLRASADRNIRLHMRFWDASNSEISGTRVYGNTISAGMEGYSTITTTVPQGTAILNLYLNNANSISGTTTQEYKRLKLERGSKATDWTTANADPASGVKTSKVTIDGTGIAMTTGGTFTVGSQNFNIDAAGNVVMKGTVEAAAGKIGGFTISGNKLVDTATGGTKAQFDPVTGTLILNDLEITQEADAITFRSRFVSKLRYFDFSNPNGSIVFRTANPTNGAWMTRFDVEMPTAAKPDGRTYNYGDSYIYGNCSAQSFTDRTPAYFGDALDELRWTSGSRSKGIDHSSLPKFARKTIIGTRINEDGSKEDYEEEGRDLGAMVSVLTRAVQQLADKVDSQQRLIEDLNRRVSA